MPALSFSRDEFVPKILELRKPHTLRRRRKHAIKPGDLLTLYYKQRTKDCRMIALTVCKKVEPVVIYVHARMVKVNGKMLAHDEAVALARRDGFQHAEAFFSFFEQYQRLILDDFVLITWDTACLLDMWHWDPYSEDVKQMGAKERLAFLNTCVDIGKAMETPLSSSTTSPQIPEEHRIFRGRGGRDGK